MHGLITSGAPPHAITVKEYVEERRSATPVIVLAELSDKYHIGKDGNFGMDFIVAKTRIRLC